MSRISDVFNKSGHKALIAYVTVGYPDVEATLKVVPILVESGVDIIELGIPFSDPLADGATIQKASFQALQNGVTTKTCLEVACTLRRKLGAPLIFMTYYNPVLAYGLQKFSEVSAASGIDGLIIPDLPPDEGAELDKFTKKCGIDLIYLLAPTSTGDRIKLVAESSRGFIYLVSVAGVTGARTSLPADLSKFVNHVKTIAKQPVCVGFGIATPEQAAQVGRIADGVIIGSRLIQLMETDDGTMSEIRTLITKVRKVLV